MWHVATKKHEAFRAVILKALAFLTSVLKPKELRFLFDKLQTLPLKEQDKFSLGLLKAIAKVLAPNNAVLKLDKSLFKEKDDFIQGKAGLVGVKQKRRLYFDEKVIFERVLIHKISLPERIRFYAYMKFLIQNPNDFSGLHQWMRVVYNLSENTQLNSAEEAEKAIKSIVDNLEINAKTKVGNLSPISAQNPMKL